MLHVIRNILYWDTTKWKVGLFRYFCQQPPPLTYCLQSSCKMIVLNRKCCMLFKASYTWTSLSVPCIVHTLTSVYQLVHVILHWLVHFNPHWLVCVTLYHPTSSGPCHPTLTGLSPYTDWFMLPQIIGLRHPILTGLCHPALTGSRHPTQTGLSP